MLQCVTHFYVQDAISAQLLAQKGLQNYQLCGDTRVDRVMELPRTNWHEPTLAAFAAGGPLLVAGSTWPADEKLLLELLQHPQLQSLRLLIAPHQPSEAHSVQLQKLFGSTCQRYSQTNPQQAASARVLVLDTIGMLNKAYRYGQFAYVGGGFGKSIHNLLEPAVYGIPVFFGPKHHKFPEAFGLQQAGMGHAVHNSDELQTALLHYWQSPERQAQARQQATHWFAGQAGATQRILTDIQQLLPG
jgi:3-deoxy-D-manno-octulosonic-acid transferase